MWRFRTASRFETGFNRMLEEVDSLNEQAATLPPLIRNQTMRIYTAIIVALSCHLARRLRRRTP